MKCYDVVILSTVCDLWTSGFMEHVCFVSETLSKNSWRNVSDGLLWVWLGMRYAYICHIVYMCVYVVANKTCDNTEPCFQSASVRLCVQKVASRPKDKAMGTGRGLAWFRKKATFNGKQPSCFHISTHPIPVFLGMYNSFMPIWELQEDLEIRMTFDFSLWRKKLCV